MYVHYGRPYIIIYGGTRSNLAVNAASDPRAFMLS